MASHIVKCKKCGKLFDTNKYEFIKEKNRYSHKICPELSPEEQKKEEERLNNEHILVNYIKEKYGEEIYNSTKTWVQLSKYKKEYDLDDKKLYQVLYYITDIKKRNLKNGFGLIPYYLDEAEKYFKELNKINQANENIIMNPKALDFETIEVTILSPQRKKKKKKLFTFLDEEVKSDE